MGFDHPEVRSILSKIDKNKLLLIDWKAHLKVPENYVFQDFGKAFYVCLEEALHLFKKYKALCFVYPEYTYHPKESIEYFKEFCITHNIPYSICVNSNEFIIEKNTAYITVNDRMLYELLNQCRLSNFELGTDVGVLSYNDTPLKEFTYKGISVVSIDFKEFGNKVANFINTTPPFKTFLKTQLILRESL
jgi:DNA-binding LacI/PurR family transcriptional regulator